MKNFPSYSSYRDAAIEWIPKIPAHWDDAFVKFCFDVQLGKMLQSKPENSSDIEMPYLKAFHVNWNGISTVNLPQMFASIADIEKYEVKNGDMLVCEGGEVGRSAILKSLEEPAIIQNALHRVRDTKIGSVEYLNYLMRSIADAGWFDILCNKATIAHLTGEKLGAIRIPVPSKEEQKQITDFLDHKIAQIDRLIEKKKALIEKLNEKRIALITQAVTNGLNPDAPMKSSGVDWLGDVPAHWDVRRLRFAIQSNPLKSKIDDLVCDDMVSFVPMDAVGEYGGMRLDMEKPLEEVYDGYTYFRDNDVVIAKITPCFENGKGAKAEGLTNGVAFGTTELHVMRPLEGYSSRWLFYLSICHSFREIGASEMYGAGGQKRVPESFIKDFRIGIPNFDEQESIADFIDSEVKKMDEMLKVNNQTINRLTEYRTALITAAVTGKIDVSSIDVPDEEAA
jgi:type I restriction enzyme S subunit